MSIKKTINNKGEIQIIFLSISGKGWLQKLFSVIASTIYPEVITRKDNNNSEFIFFIKNGKECVLQIDEYDCIALYAKNEDCDEKIIEYWAKIIDDKLNNGY